MQSTILIRDVIIYAILASGIFFFFFGIIAIGFGVFGPRFSLSFNLLKS